MKTYYVYELVNLMGTVEHVGETTRPIKRFANHIKHKPSKGNGIGLFYGRHDLIMNIVSKHYSKLEAFNYQCELQKQYGLKTDREKYSRKDSLETRNKKALSKKGKSRPQWVKDKIRATMLLNKS
jgi:hypothetical protein